MLRHYNYQNYGYYNEIPPSNPIVLAQRSVYITISNIVIYPNDIEFLSGFDFKVNKRGGDTSKITFSGQSIPTRIGDKIKLYVQDDVKYTGFIEQQTYLNSVFEITVIPEWSKLLNVIVSGGIVVESEISIQSLVQSLQSLIVGQDIGYTFVNIPAEYTITTATMGKSVGELLDECEENLPKGYVWGVIKGHFFFTLIDTIPINSLNWRNNDFSTSEVQEDYSDIYTQTSVFVKETDGEGNEQNRSVGIVGDGGDYKKIPFYDLIGIKMNKYEFPFAIAIKTALDYAYNLLINQFAPINIKIKNLNFEQKLPNILEAWLIESIPQTYLTNNFYKLSQNQIVGTQSNTFGGFIQKTNQALGTTVIGDNLYLFNLSHDKEYIDFCNGSDSVTSIYIEYTSVVNTIEFQISDGITNVLVAGAFGRARVNLTSFNLNKRDLTVLSLTQALTFSYKFIAVTFTNAQKVYSGTIRKINYKMNSSFIMSVDLEIANTNTVLNGYLFNENKKIVRLSEILSLTGVN